MASIYQPKLKKMSSIILITGASSGIGKALAIEAHTSGNKVSLASRNIDKILEYTSHWNQEDYLVSAVDVTSESACRELIDQTIRKFGRLDVLINNAGISMRALFEEADLQVLHQLMDTNFWGTVYCTKYALPYLLQSKGSLVGVSSVAGYKGLPGRTGYSASKFAMQGFLEVVRIENLKKGLHVLIACPGFTASNIRKVALSKDGTPQGETPLDEHKLMSAETVAREILNAVHRRKSNLILTTQGKMTVWLNKFFPSFMDRMVYNHMAREKDSPIKS